jgi:hypothetical protein
MNGVLSFLLPFVAASSLGIFGALSHRKGPDSGSSNLEQGGTFLNRSRATSMSQPA